jgi:hypothetical protein
MKGSSEEHFFTLGAVTNPSDWDVALLLDEFDVVLGVDRQFRELSCFADVLGPSGQVSVDSLAFGKLLDCSWHGSFKSLPVELVVRGDFQVFYTCEHIELSDVQRVESIELVSVLDNV